MKTVRGVEVLSYYDGVVAFLGADDAGGEYVGLLVDAAGARDRYAVTAATPARLRLLRAGEIDLRELMLEGTSASWFLASAPDAFGEPMTLEPQSGPLPESCLPDPGFMLAAPVDAAR